MKPRLLFAAVFISILLTGCREPYLKTAAGNSNVRRGRYQNALSNYLEGIHKNGNPSTLQYNIGNVYYYLGETEKAAAIWGQAADSSSKETVYRSFFNQGVVHYQAGRFSRGADCFLRAVKAAPDRIEAKINLELCIKKISEQNEVPSGGAGIEETPDMSDRIPGENSLLLRLIKEGELSSLKQEESASTDQDGGPVRDW